MLVYIQPVQQHLYEHETGVLSHRLVVPFWDMRAVVVVAIVVIALLLSILLLPPAIIIAVSSTREPISMVFPSCTPHLPPHLILLSSSPIPTTITGQWRPSAPPSVSRGAQTKRALVPIRVLDDLHQIGQPVVQPLDDLRCEEDRVVVVVMLVLVMVVVEVRAGGGGEEGVDVLARARHDAEGVVRLVRARVRAFRRWLVVGDEVCGSIGRLRLRRRRRQ